MPPSSPAALLLVDGYNVIGAWPYLKKLRDAHGLEASRRELLEALINYSTYQGYKTEVVFDAHAQNTPSYSEVLTTHLSVCYTDFGQTADTYIEKFCASFRFSSTYSTCRIIVATSDRAQQLTVAGYGAEWVSSLQLANDVEFITRRTRRQQRPQKQSGGRFLFNSLDAQSQKRLAEWCRGMK